MKSITDFATEHMQASRKLDRYAEEDRKRTISKGGLKWLKKKRKKKKN